MGAKVNPNDDFDGFLAGVRKVAELPESIFDPKFKLECGHVVEVTSHKQLGSCPACGKILLFCPQCMGERHAERN